MNSEFEEVEVDLEPWELNIVDRLVREGLYTSQDEAVAAAIRYNQGGDIDPRAEQRIDELKEIGEEAESDVLAHFFADTTEIMRLYAQVAYESKDRDVSEDVNINYDIFTDYVLRPDNRDEEFTGHFLDGLFSQAQQLSIIAEGDTVETAKVTGYLEKYSKDDMEMLL